MREENTSTQYLPVPPNAERLFRMCWQLESWFRLMVYVELKASRSDWETPIKRKVRGWPPNSLARDKALHHMATHHEGSLSYVSFGELWDVVSDTTNWDLFEPYLPPKDNMIARVAEIKAIRNRVAHFREPNDRDVARLSLFIEDLEDGVRRFCRRYTSARSPSRAPDPVAALLETIWEKDGYGVELWLPGGDWLYAPEPERGDPLMNARLEVLLPLGNPTNGAGEIYRVMVEVGNRFSRNADGPLPIDAIGIFDRTVDAHNEIIHFVLSGAEDRLWVTIPAVLGAQRVAELVMRFVKAGMEFRMGTRDGAPAMADVRWPEYVIWPGHPLSAEEYEPKQQMLFTV